MANVLTVDDSPGIYHMVKLVLGAAGHTVVAASDGAAGLSKAKSQAFDLVITDLNLPVMKGMRMIRALRGGPTYNGVPLAAYYSRAASQTKLAAEAMHPLVPKKA